MKENLRQKLIKKLNEMDKNQKNHELERKFIIRK